MPGKQLSKSTLRVRSSDHAMYISRYYNVIRGKRPQKFALVVLLLLSEIKFAIILIQKLKQLYLAYRFLLCRYRACSLGVSFELAGFILEFGQ